MSFEYLQYEAPAERLLLVRLEESSYGGEHRHVTAHVVRRAVDHTYRENGTVLEWRDGKDAQGYRSCSWSKSTTGAIYTASMELRGQIDATSNPLREGRPYGNGIEFKPHSVDKNTAKAIYDTYSKYEKFCEKQSNGTRDDFAAELFRLSQFLRISKFLFYKNPRSYSLSNPLLFDEADYPEACNKIAEIIAPFYKPRQEQS